jgi:circadian clock protein KaiC
MQTEVDVSYLADTVILLRYLETDGEIRQVLSVIKQRVGPHERTLRELRMTRNGINISETLSSFRGVLREGSPHSSEQRVEE